MKTPFLNRFSNTRNFSAHEFESKINTMATEMEKLKQFMGSTEKFNADAKEELESSKRKCKGYSIAPAEPLGKHTDIL